MNHSVMLDAERCCGCTVCVKACPTEAIRVRRGKAVILEDRCIDCGRCVQVCPHHAKRVVSDSISAMERYEYNIILPDPVLYGQFQNLEDPNIVHEGFRSLGFDAVMDVAEGAELLSNYCDEHEAEIWNGPLPRISSACPASVRLIAMEYPELIPNLMNLIVPFEAAAIVARARAMRKTGLPSEKIGICLISPCPAQNTRARMPIGFSEPVIDYVLPVGEIYRMLLGPMKEVQNPQKSSHAGRRGFQWVRPGGQCANIQPRLGLAVDGVDDVFSIFEEAEDGKLGEVQYIEPDFCRQACFGGCLCVENPYVAKLRTRKIVDRLPERVTDGVPEELERQIFWAKPLEETQQFLAQDLGGALRVQSKAQEILRTLPKLDCGSCGAPSCAAFSRDVAQGFAQSGDCIFNIIKKMRGGAVHEEETDEFVPPPFRKPIREKTNTK